MRLFLTCILIISTGLLTGPVLAKSVYQAEVQSPSRKMGYFVGDQLKRTIELDVLNPYVLTTASIPSKGSFHSGIELRKAKLDTIEGRDSTRYKLELTYQIFRRDHQAKKMSLPPLRLQLKGTKQARIVKIDKWDFEVSPLSAYGETYVEKHMSPYRGPMLLKSGHLKPVLGTSFFVVILTMLALVYIHADRAWFPGMGGPFAASYREIEKLPDTSQGAFMAAAHIQRAFNQLYGQPLFLRNFDDFCQSFPRFRKYQPEIADFFRHSNRLLFAASSSHTVTPLEHLKNFCRLCRDCERGVA
jgi:mxaA protein